jgi:hypothetical protein
MVLEAARSQNFENQMIILDILGSAVLATSKKNNILSFRIYLLNTETGLSFKNWWL